jgi:hypothetical protein
MPSGTEAMKKTIVLLAVLLLVFGELLWAPSATAG